MKYPLTLLLSLAQALLILVVIAAVIITLKIVRYEQPVNETALSYKQEYLAGIEKIANNIDAKAPNIVFVLYDDLGYGDFSHTGSEAIQTPNIDELAANGAVIESFYAPAPVCTPSRFGYLTGRHAERGGMSHVVFPENHTFDRIIRARNLNVGIPPSEITIADILSAAGYQTGLIGKWHLGDQPGSRPLDMGFDYFYGSLYSNDMTPFALYQNDNVVIEAPVDQTQLSELYVNQSTSFVQFNKDRPFFLFLSHNFPHIPLYVSPDKSGQSDAGLYGDVVEELDSGIGELIRALKDSGVYDNTMIILSSDNGPWYQGSAGSMRGRKGETFEGGMRVPFIAHWPQGICDGCELNGIASGLDVMPTIMEAIGLPLPTDRSIDGISLLGFLQHQQSSPREFLYYLSGSLYGVRDERFKYMPERPVMYAIAGVPLGVAQKRGPWLFDLSKDPNESYDVSDRYPEHLKRLQGEYERKMQALDKNRSGYRLDD